MESIEITDKVGVGQVSSLDNTQRRFRRAAGSLVALVVLAAAAACGGDDGGSGDGAGTASTLRLGYFPNVTHATPVVGVAKDFFGKRLGSTKLETQTFNAGPAEIEALLGGDLDAGFIGPNPAINAYAKTKGAGIRIIAGATSGGASLVVQPGINSAADLKGKRIASPQLGNTQDVALRAWLKKNGLTPSSQGVQGDVQVEPSENATTLQLFGDKKIDGAWVPEPWASRLVLDGGGKVLVDEKTLWPGGKFVTTHLIVRTEFLEKYPATVKALLEGQVDTDEWIAKNSDQAKTTVNAEIKRITTKALAPEVLDRAWSNIEITTDPIAASLKKSADDAVAAGLLKEVDLKGIYDLTLLREVLSERGGATVDDAGLAKG
jgi:NitT/TauT family transport system substrate-binding protein